MIVLSGKVLFGFLIIGNWSVPEEKKTYIPRGIQSMAD